MVRGSRQGGAAQKPRPAQALPQPRLPEPLKTKKPPAGGQIPGQELCGFWGPNGAGKGPLLCGITGGRRGIPAKKAADAALRGIASAAFCMVVLFWVAFGKVRVCVAPPPPGRKTRRPVFQPLCHACRMVSSAGAWQKE